MIYFMSGCLAASGKGIFTCAGLFNLVAGHTDKKFGGKLEYIICILNM